MIGTWEEMTASWRHDSLFDYTPNTICKLIVDKMNTKYGFYGFDGGHMRDIKDFEKELGIKHEYLTLPWEKSLNVKKIIHSGPCTIVIWGDGEKTIVRQSKDDDWDEYAAFCAAFCKRFFGSTSAVKRIIKKKTVPYRPTNEEKKEDEKLNKANSTSKIEDRATIKAGAGEEEETK